jgi:hypothetical protein
MEFLGLINAEGGPLLLADGALIKQWTGISGAEYERACAVFDADASLEGSTIPLGSGAAWLWEMRGAGTAAVFRKNDEHFVLLRIWPNDPRDAGAPRTIATAPMIEGIELGSLLVETGVLAIISAVDEGNCIELPTSLLGGAQQARPRSTTQDWCFMSTTKNSAAFMTVSKQKRVSGVGCI